MKNIDLEKFGFRRAPEKDFLYNGKTYVLYTFGDGDIFVNKVYDNDIAFIFTTSTRAVNISSCPHYNLSIIKNRETITEEELNQLYTDCMLFETELKQVALRQFRQGVARKDFCIYDDDVDFYQRVIKSIGAEEDLELFKKNLTKSKGSLQVEIK